MADDRDLIAGLKAVEQHLASIPPAGSLEDRLAARLRDEEGPRWQRFFLRGPSARHRPLLALGLAAGLVGAAMLLGPHAIAPPLVPSAGQAPPEPSPGSSAVDLEASPSSSASSRPAPRSPTRHGPLLLEAPHTPVSPVQGDPVDGFARTEAVSRHGTAPTRHSFVMTPDVERMAGLAAGIPPETRGIRSLPPLDRRENPVLSASSSSPGGAGIASVAGTTTSSPGNLAPTPPPRSTAPRSTGTSPPTEPPHTTTPTRSCQTADALKQLAFDECKRRDQGLEDVVPLDPCPGGGFAAAHVTCSTSSDDDPSSSSCEWQSRDVLACVSYDQALALAIDDCTAQGMKPLDLEPALDCQNGGSTVMKWRCDCEGADPGAVKGDPSTSDTCVEGLVGDAGQCRDKDVLVSMAAQQCTDAGLTLTNALPLETCEDGTFAQLGITCCKSQ